MAELEFAPLDPEHEALAARLPAEWVKAAESRYSMHGSGLVRNLLAGAVPLIRAAERDRAASAVAEFARTAPGRYGHHGHDSAAYGVLRRVRAGLEALAAGIRGEPAGNRGEEKAPGASGSTEEGPKP